MPRPNGLEVVNQPYGLAGNGGRKIAYLKSKEIVIVTKDTAGLKLYKSVPNGTSYSKMYIDSSNVGDASIVSFGNNIGLLRASGQTRINFSVVDCADDTVIGGVKNLDSEQTAIGNVSLAINKNRTRIFAAWASKNSALSKCFNIRFAEGKILPDGDTEWKPTIQLTALYTSGENLINPTVGVDANDEPYVIAEGSEASAKYITCFSKSFTGKQFEYYGDATWGNKEIYNAGSWAQSFPTTVFVPKSVNGLSEGRIWVAWHGGDSMAAIENIRVSYSDDSGQSWSAMTKLTNGTSVYHKKNPSITANHKNEIFIKYEDSFMDGSITANNISGYVYQSNKWVSQGPDYSDKSYNPNALFDPDFKLNFTKAVHAYTNLSSGKVLIRGSYVYSSSSIEDGSNIEEREERSDLVSYSITTDDSMETVTEKVNGVVIGTKTLTNKQETTLALTKEQWSKVPTGLYTLSEEKLPVSVNSIDWEQNAWGSSVSNKISSVTNSNYVRLKKPIIVNPGDKISVIAPGVSYLKVLEVDIDGDVIREYVVYNENAFEVSRLAYKLYINIYKSTGITPSTVPLGLALYLQEYKRNTITIEMGTDSWNYVFNKQLNGSYTAIELIESVDSAAKNHIPAMKEKIGKELKRKGAYVPIEPNFEQLCESISEMELGKRYAIGTSTTNSSAKFTITGLDFVPTIFYAKITDSTNEYYDFVLYADSLVTGSKSGLKGFGILGGQSGSGSNLVTVIGNTIEFGNGQSTFIPINKSYSWIAFE